MIDRGPTRGRGVLGVLYCISVGSATPVDVRFVVVARAPIACLCRVAWEQKRGGWG